MNLETEISFDKRMYGIKDVKTGKFVPPFICDSDGEAKRTFEDVIISSNESLIARHPEDYDLYFLGCFDTVTGMHTGTSAQYIMNAQEVVSEYQRKFKNSLNNSSSHNECECNADSATDTVA